MRQAFLLLARPRAFGSNPFSPLEALGVGASGKKVASAFDKALPLFWNLPGAPPPTPAPASAKRSCSCSL